MFNMTLAELVRGKPVSTMPTEVYADLIQEKIDSVADLEVECERLRGEVAEQIDMETKYGDALQALRNLVTAIDGSAVGKVCKVGALIVVEGRGELSGRAELGEALTAARALL